MGSTKNDDIIFVHKLDQRKFCSHRQDGDIDGNVIINDGIKQHRTHASGPNEQQDPPDEISGDRK